MVKMGKFKCLLVSYLHILDKYYSYRWEKLYAHKFSGVFAYLCTSTHNGYTWVYISTFIGAEIGSMNTQVNMYMRAANHKVEQWLFH